MEVYILSRRRASLSAGDGYRGGEPPGRPGAPARSAARAAPAAPGAERCRQAGAGPFKKAQHSSRGRPCLPQPAALERRWGMGSSSWSGSERAHVAAAGAAAAAAAGAAVGAAARQPSSARSAASSVGISALPGSLTRDGRS